MKHYKGIAGKRAGKLKGVMIHNDAGGNGATKSFYEKWLKSHPAENGFANAYVTSTGTLLFENEANRAWHAGDYNANNDYYSIEVCQSKGNKEQFLNNERKAIILAAKILKKNGLKANRSTVRFHQEFFATSCPHRTLALHGKSVNKAKDYLIAEINKINKVNKVNSNQKGVEIVTAGQLLENHGRIVLAADRALYDRIPKKKTPFKRVIKKGQYFYNGLYTYGSYKGVDSWGKTCDYVQIRDLNNGKLLGYAPVYKSDSLYRYTLEKIIVR